MLKDITLTNNKGFSFTISQNDWEDAPDPICMCMVTSDQWDKVGNYLQSLVNEITEEDDYDDCEDYIWSKYESAVLQFCNTFYYEDLDDNDYQKLISITDEKKQIEFAEQLYSKLIPF